MYEIIKRRLERGGYTLVDARKRLHYLVAQGEIEPEQAEELEAVAETHADMQSADDSAATKMREQLAGNCRATKGLAKVVQALVDTIVPAAKKPLVQPALEALRESLCEDGGEA